MSPKPLPPTPPDLNEQPRSSVWTIVLAGVALLFLMTGLSFLTLGYFAPVIALGVGVFFLIGIQYLVWGWWFERVYRQGRDQSED